MQGKATLVGHPIHPMMVPLPIGFYVGALICDVIRAFTHNPFWPQVSVVLIGFGIVGALLAALFGFIDYGTTPMSATAKATTTRHMVIVLLASAIFAVAFWLRLSDNVSTVGIILTALGVIVLGVGGYLGGHLAYHFGIGVDQRTAERPANILSIE